jgi:hypothetical protein
MGVYGILGTKFQYLLMNEVKKILSDLLIMRSIAFH